MSTQYLSPHYNPSAATAHFLRTYSPPVLSLLHLWNIHANPPPLPLLDPFSHICSQRPVISKSPPQNSHDGPPHTLLTQHECKFHIQISLASLSTSILIKLVSAEILSLLHFKMRECRELPLLRNLKSEAENFVFLRVGMSCPLDVPTDHEFS